MKRKAYNDLLRWKQSDSRKPLLLLGARQVGKTWLMNEFGKNEYDNVAYINCDRSRQAAGIFADDYDTDRILLNIQALTGQSISPGKTLIVIDEIQEAPRGISCLKYFCEDKPDYHVMAAGSLLGITLGRKESFPVGKVDMITLYPLDFNEFVEAIAGEMTVRPLLSLDWNVIGPISSMYSELLRQYYFVGGMPEAVSDFVAKKDLTSVRRIQSDIIQAYRDDMSKHTTKAESVRIGQVFESLPSQLARENQKFIFGAVRQGARAADFEVAIQWLIDAGVIYRVSRVSVIRMPLKFYECLPEFKLFLLDVGLLGCMAEIPAASILIRDNSVVEFKGMLTENYMAQQIKAAGITPYYWSKKTSAAEIDFAIQLNGRAWAVEVKAETNLRAKSLAQYIKDNPGTQGLRFSMLGYEQWPDVTNIPLFAAESYLENSTGE